MDTFRFPNQMEYPRVDRMRSAFWRQKSTSRVKWLSAGDGTGLGGVAKIVVSERLRIMGGANEDEPKVNLINYFRNRNCSTIVSRREYLVNKSWMRELQLDPHRRSITCAHMASVKSRRPLRNESLNPENTSRISSS
jgi:hypothetical protein